MFSVKKSFLYYITILIMAVTVLGPAPALYAKTTASKNSAKSSRTGNGLKQNAEDSSLTGGNGGNLKVWLDVCRTMGLNMSKKGFRYSYNARAHSYSKALSGSRKTNCSRYVCWCLQEYGAIQQGQTFHVKRGGRIKKNFDSWDSSKVSVIKVYKSCRAADLQPGDVVCWAGKPHMCIYAGRNSKGDRLWFDAGRQNTHGKRSGSRYKAITASRSSYLDSREVGYIIRIKGL